MKQHIPNFITLLNLFCGCIATVFAVMNNLEWAALFVFFGILFDFLDGLAARALGVSSAIGVQLDSLADMVTSGVVPGIVMFQLMNMAHFGGWNSVLTEIGAGSTFGGNEMALLPLPFLGFLITLASAYRLANFNLDENQVDYFQGLPTPANTLLILSLPLILLYQNNDTLNAIILNQWFLVGLTLLSVYLLNSKIRLFSLKFKDWSFSKNGLKYLFLIGSLILLLTLKFLAIPLIILLYVLTSLLQRA